MKARLFLFLLDAGDMFQMHVYRRIIKTRDDAVEYERGLLGDVEYLSGGPAQRFRGYEGSIPKFTDANPKQNSRTCYYVDGVYAGCR
jgi:hypothetical protein